jgi:hypothetical protein
MVAILSLLSAPDEFLFEHREFSREISSIDRIFALQPAAP